MIRRFVVLAGLALVSAAPAAGQVALGSVAGTVADPAKQPLAHATVTAADAAHAVSRAVQTDDRGRYRIVDLPPAVYTIGADAPGFGHADTAGVVVAVNSTIAVDFDLPIAAVAETVDVSATVRRVQTASADLGTVIDRSRIDALPLNRRDFLQLSLLVAGVEGPVANSELSTRGGFSMHANGGREEFNDFLLDGADNNDPYVNGYVVQPSVDSIEEFKVSTNSYSAQYGRNAAGQVDVVTRRGSSRLEGSAYEYFRNRALNARNYFETGDKQPFTRNQFGGGIGGPLVGDRTFFFGSIDLLREHEVISRLTSVPTGAERAGDLSDMGQPVIDPLTGAPFSGNIIPAGRISPIARDILNLFPVANQTGAANYLAQPAQSNDRTLGTVRIDHRAGPNDTITGRYSDGIAHSLEPFTEDAGVASGFGDYVNDRTWNTMVEHRHVFAGSGTNSVRLAANSFSRDLLPENYQVNVGAAWGVSWLNVPPESFGYPVIDVAGYARVGDSYSLPLLRHATTYQVADDLTLERRSHFLKMGGDVRYVRLDSTVDLYSRGQLAFTGAFTGSGIGDLLLGLPTFGIQAQADNPIRMRTAGWSGYFEDEWRARPNLTLSLGTRYEYLTPPVDAHNGMTIYDASTGQLVQAGTNGYSRSGFSPDRDNLAPRLGVSWAPSANTVIRGGYGVFYDSGMLTVNTSQYFNPPEFNVRLFTPGPAGLLTLDNPFPLTGSFVPPPTLSALSPNLTTGYLQHWNVALQREIASVGSLTVAYAGSKGSNLIRAIDLNQPTPGPGDVQARRPNPAFGDIFYVESTGRSRFDSLQITFDRPLMKRASLLAVYTLAKSMDDASAFLGTPADTNFPQDSHNPDAEWGPSSFDVRHRLAVAYIVQLPDSNRWTRNMQVQGITTLHTGQPFTPILRFDNSNTGNTGGSTAGSDRPNQVADPTLANPTPAEWFNTAAFVIAPKDTFGDAPRNSVRGPGFATFDASVSKQVRVATRRVVISLQAFNLFNHTNFDLPEHYVDEPSTFGRILSAEAPRQLQLMARFAF